ncbi:MAG: hypothetical protein GEV28_22435 [Actinophytocola sp.]|uniref:hypothetical protein n=1 Tax=Actinophytocola sp. TaxID=1872138 RepID=UPI00132C6C9E|nr:hypothetical protein [Actinophytocola sp.]MPZ82997.1 hypothetical protein [Actinophytocola sp.]
MTVNPGAGVPYYYGWRLSRNRLFGRRCNVNVCDSSGNCTYQGDVGYQAQFSMNGRQIRLIRGAVTSELNTTAEIAQDVFCGEKPSTSCGEQFTAFGALPVGGTNIHYISNFYPSTLPKTTPTTSRSNSGSGRPVRPRLCHRCTDRSTSSATPLHDPDPNGIGECYYPHFAEGDSA